MKRELKILELGDIYFFYRPKVEVEEVHAVKDIQRLSVVLKGINSSPYRLLLIGKKQLPSYYESPLEFAFVDSVYKNPNELVSVLESQTYETKTHGERDLSAARLFAEGKYILLKDGTQTHLVYNLDPHQRLGDPQVQFNLEYVGNWIVTVKNPSITSEKGLPPEQKAQFPKTLQSRFKDRKFIPLNPVTYLNYPGAELLLIAEKTSPEEKWGEIREQFESFSHCDSLKAFKLDKTSISTKPFAGTWA